MKILKILPFIVSAFNSNSYVLTNNENTSICMNFPQSRANTVGFRGDFAENKRAIVWSGEKIEFQYKSETQQGANQFCIWNEWYFKSENNLEMKYDNKSYNEYINWKCLNFWGDDSKNGNSHNIKNKLIIESVNQEHEGFYNLQYNYKSGGTLGIQNHIFSSFPFQLIVVPKNINANISANKSKLYYGETLSINLLFDDNNIYKYIDSNLLLVTYQWKVNINGQWIELANSENQINNLILDPGHYKFYVEVKLDITNDNNIYNPADMNITSNIIDINVLDNINIKVENVSINDSAINLKSLIYYKNSITTDQHLIDWAWYKYNYENSKYEFYSTNNQISIDLYNSSAFIFRASTIDNKETKWSNEFIVKNPIIIHELNLLINDFDYFNNYSYLIYDSNNNIYKNENVNNNQPINLIFDSSGIYKICINQEDGKQIWQLIEIKDEEKDEELENPNLPENEIQEENKTPIYKEPWFYIVIAASSILLIILIIWLIKYWKNKKN